MSSTGIQEGLLTSLVESAADAIIAVSTDFRVIAWNGGAERMFGYDANEAVGKLMLDIFHPSADTRAEAERIMRADLAAMKEHGAFARHSEAAVPRKDGSLVDVSIVAGRIVDAKGEIIGMSVIMRDISERKRLLEQLQKNEAYYKSLLDGSSDVVLAIDKSGLVCFATSSVEAIFGYTQEEVQGQPVSSYAHPDDSALVLERLSKAPELPNAVTPVRVRHKDGTWRECEGVGRQVSGPDDVPLIIINVRDVTERKQFERARETFQEQLKKREAYFRTLIENSSDVVLAIDTEGKIVFAGGSHERLFRRKPEEAIGTPAFSYIHPDDLAESAKKMAEVSINPHVGAEARIRRGDGTWCECESRGRALIGPDGEDLVVLNIREIGEHKRVERERATLAAIVESSQDPIIGFSREFKITSWNGAAAKSYGYGSEEAIGRGFDLILPPDELPQATNVSHRLFATGQAESLEQRTRTRDGTWVTSLVNFFAIRDPAGTIIGGAEIARDITKLKAIERELRDAHEYTRGLIESSVDAMVMVDRKMHISDCNEQLAKLTELPKKMLIGSSFDSYFADPLQARAAIEKTLADGYLTNFDLTLKAASGTEIPIAFNASLFYSTGKVLGIFGVARNVTEQRATERMLRAEREYSQRLVQSSPDAILVCDSNLMLTDANQEAARLTGYTRQGLIGVSLSSLFSDSPQAAELIAKSRNGAVAMREVELDLLTKTADLIPVSLNAASFKDGDSSMRRIVVALRDTSERKRAEKERSLLAAIVGSSGDAIYSENSDTVITSWNPAAERLFGYTAAEAVGRSAALLVPLDRRAELAEHFQRVLETRNTERFETTRLRKDGSLIEVALSQSPIVDSSGAVVAVSVTAHDISDRRRMEMELTKARDAALEAARVKSEFLANMSHEIRTPLNSIIGLTGLLADTELSTEQREFVQDVRQSGNSLLTLINEILDFSKIAAGKLELEEIPFELNSMLEGAVELVAEEARRKNLELTLSLDCEVPRLLRGDPGRLRQVLVNLLGNAVKFTERGEVNVQVSKLSESPRDTNLRFEVHDTGIGIPEGKQHLLFQPFSQTDSSTTRHFGGTGLGLSIARQLVEHMGGTIAVSSAPGAGSTFWFTALLAKQVDASVPAEKRFAAMSGVKILIVDDNANSRQILSRQVSSWGMDARTAPSAREAVDMMRLAAGERPYQVALIDIMMPDVDGIELARRIKSEPALVQTAIVFVSSAGPKKEFTARLKEIGYRGWLMKPVSESLLYKVLTEVLKPPAEGESGVLMPSEETSTQKLAPKKLTLPAGRRLRALVAEDNLINQKVAKLQLGKIGIEVDVVANGREAVDAAMRLPYDVIFMDCQMPEMDGYEATREIRRREGATHHTIIAMTAYAMAGDREKCLAAGMDAYIGKPVTTGALESVLAEVLKQASLPAAEAGTDTAATADSPDGKRAQSGAVAEERTSERNDSSAASAVPPLANNPVAPEPASSRQPAATSEAHAKAVSAKTAASAAEVTGPSQDACDRATIEGLRQEGEQYLRDLVALFNAELSKSLEKLADALAKGDSKTTSLVAHTLKGTAAIFGARRMQELAATMDNAAREGSLEKPAALFEEFRAECNRVRELLNAANHR